MAADNLEAADCDSEQADHGKSDQEGARQSDEDDQAGDQQRARTDFEAKLMAWSVGGGKSSA